jgi:hypothetical protein
MSVAWCKVVTVICMFKMFLPRIRAEFARDTSIHNSFVWYLIISNRFGEISRLFEHTQSQYSSYVARDLLIEVICAPHVEKFGDPWFTGLIFHTISLPRC